MLNIKYIPKRSSLFSNSFPILESLLDFIDFIVHLLMTIYMSEVKWRKSKFSNCVFILGFYTIYLQVSRKTFCFVSTNTFIAIFYISDEETLEWIDNWQLILSCTCWIPFISSCTCWRPFICQRLLKTSWFPSIKLLDSHQDRENCECDVYGWLEIPSQLMCSHFFPLCIWIDQNASWH